MSKNIVLVGFMGAGKSVAAKELAKRLKQRAVSTDDLLEKQEKRRIADIFRDSGEAYFRRQEKALIRKLSSQTGLIIDCGGGAFLDQENIDHLNSSGVTIYLEAGVDEIARRTEGLKHRPLLNVDDPHKKIKELLTQRKPFYAQALHTIHTDGKGNRQVCDEIMKVLKPC